MLHLVVVVVEVLVEALLLFDWQLDVLGGSHAQDLVHA